MPTWIARGPGSDWQIAIDSRICSFVSHLRSSTSSRSICPTSATGPPKPRKPRRRKYRTNSLIRPLGIVVVVVMSFHSVANSWCLENTFKGQSQSGRLHLDALARERNFVTTIIRFLEIKAEFVLLDCPFADFLRSHRIASQRAIAVVNVAPMHLVSELHPGELRADLTPGKLLRILSGSRANLERD